jgi:hypothetical protein
MGWRVKVELDNQIVIFTRREDVEKVQQTRLNLHQTQIQRQLNLRIFRESGLWLVNNLYKEPLSDDDIEQLDRSIS